jgi:hypothetical protein
MADPQDAERWRRDLLSMTSQLHPSRGSRLMSSAKGEEERPVHFWIIVGPQAT